MDQGRSDDESSSRQGSEQEQEDSGDPGSFTSRWAECGWLIVNPVGAPTEREVFLGLVTGEAVYRMLLERQ
jgi:hypothetical protein